MNLNEMLAYGKKDSDEKIEYAKAFINANQDLYCTECRERVELRVNNAHDDLGYFYSVPENIIPRFVEVMIHDECERSAEERHLKESEEKAASSLKEARRRVYDSFASGIDFIDSASVEMKHVKGAELLKSWKLGDDFGFIIRGPTGTGKSYAAVALAKRIAKDILMTKALHDLDGQSTFGLPVFIKMQKLYEQTQTNDFKVPSKIIYSPYLFLDDLGTENVTDFKREVFYNVIDSRFTAKRPTFITTNLSLDQIKERFFERVTSRLLGMCVPVEITGNDRRLTTVEDRIALLKSRASEANKS